MVGCMNIWLICQIGGSDPEMTELTIFLKLEDKLCWIGWVTDCIHSVVLSAILQLLAGGLDYHRSSWRNLDNSVGC